MSNVNDDVSLLREHLSHDTHDAYSSSHHPCFQGIETALPTLFIRQERTGDGDCPSLYFVIVL